MLFIVIGCLLQNLFIEESFISSEHYLSRPCQIRIYIINGFITTKFNSKTVLLSWMVFMVFISCHNHPIIHLCSLSSQGPCLTSIAHNSCSSKIGHHLPCPLFRTTTI
jgi:hypothetical protein